MITILLMISWLDSSIMSEGVFLFITAPVFFSARLLFKASASFSAGVRKRLVRGLCVGDGVDVECRDILDSLARRHPSNDFFAELREVCLAGAEQSLHVLKRWPAEVLKADHELIGAIKSYPNYWIVMPLLYDRDRGSHDEKCVISSKPSRAYRVGKSMLQW